MGVNTSAPLNNVPINPGPFIMLYSARSSHSGAKSASASSVYPYPVPVPFPFLSAYPVPAYSVQYPCQSVKQSAVSPCISRSSFCLRTAPYNAHPGQPVSYVMLQHSFRHRPLQTQTHMGRRDVLLPFSSSTSRAKYPVTAGGSVLPPGPPHSASVTSTVSYSVTISSKSL